MAEVVLSGLQKNFGSTRAVDDVSLSIGDGEFIVLLGPTGAGKTTLLRLVAGLEQPDQGSVTIHGQDATKAAPAERDVAFVFQQVIYHTQLVMMRAVEHLTMAKLVLPSEPSFTGAIARMFVKAVIATR